MALVFQRIMLSQHGFVAIATKKYADLLSKSIDSTKQVDKYFTIAGFNVSTGSISQSAVFGGILLRPWDQRKKSTKV